MQRTKIFVPVFAVFVIINVLGGWSKDVTKRSTDSQYECGKSPFLSGHAYNDGTIATRMEFPWLTAIYKKEGDRKKFICGGTLISSHHVVTAAHCLVEKDNESKTPAKDLSVFLGAHDLNDRFEEGSMIINVQKYETHTDWDSSSLDFENDIAVLFLNVKAPFSGYIRPVCLDENIDLRDISSGILAAWGEYDDSEQHSNLPRKIELNIIPKDQCFKLENRLPSNSTKGMFCAGKRGVATCHGDSGSGLYVFRNERFYLRGLVSSAIAVKCSKGFISLFTDTMNHLDFIFSSTNQKCLANLNCHSHDYGYSCVLESFIVKRTNTEIESIQTFHQNEKSNINVEFLHFRAKNNEFLVNFKNGLLTSLFPNLKVYIVEGYEDGNPAKANLNIKLRNNLRRENFIGFSGIRRLGINYCKLETLPEDVFLELLSIFDLNLHDNKIRQLPSKLLSKNTMLESLALNKNLIESVPVDFFESLYFLLNVDLNDNRITTVGVELKNLHFIREIRMERNECYSGTISMWEQSERELEIINQQCSNQSKRLGNFEGSK